MKTNFKGISGFYHVFTFLSGEVQILVVESDELFRGDQYFIQLIISADQS